jgi:hypothetical protein
MSEFKSNPLKLSNSPFLHVFAPISFGILIYILFRGSFFLHPLKDFLPILQNNLPEWVLYNLPDGLWLYSFLSCVLFIWRKNLSIGFVLWSSVAIISAIISEYFQRIKLIPGTYDLYDLIAYIIAIILFTLNLLKNRKYEK